MNKQLTGLHVQAIMKEIFFYMSDSDLEKALMLRQMQHYEHLVGKALPAKLDKTIWSRMNTDVLPQYIAEIIAMDVWTPGMNKEVFGETEAKKILREIKAGIKETGSGTHYVFTLWNDEWEERSYRTFIIYGNNTYQSKWEFEIRIDDPDRKSVVDSAYMVSRIANAKQITQGYPELRKVED